MELIRARCCAQIRPSPRAMQCSFWPKWNIDILSQNTASRTQFFQVQAIKTGHIWIIYRQTGDILSVSSQGTAAAKWWMKISIMNIIRYLCQYCSYWLQIFTVTLFQLYAKDDFNGSLQMMQGLLTLQNHCCRNQPSHFFRISVSLTDLKKLNFPYPSKTF